MYIVACISLVTSLIRNIVNYTLRDKRFKKQGNAADQEPRITVLHLVYAIVYKRERSPANSQTNGQVADSASAQRKY